MRDERIRQLLEDLAEHIASPGELAVRASALEDQASLAMPIWDDDDLEVAIYEAAGRLASRHGLNLQPPLDRVPAETGSCETSAEAQSPTQDDSDSCQRVHAQAPQHRA
jgi:hypothetical protein